LLHAKTEMHPNQKVKGIMWESARAGRLASATLGLLLSLTATTLFAQQGRKVISNPEPEYPALARRMNLTGAVKVNLVIGADGSIKDVKVQGGHPLLVEAVQKALKNWKYAAGSSETTEQVEFRFRF
jgi:TonB family protein